MLTWLKRGVAQMSDTLPLDLDSNLLGIGQHASGIADPFNGHIDAFRIAHVQRSDGWIATTWNNMSQVRSPWLAPRSGKAASRHRSPAPV